MIMIGVYQKRIGPVILRTATALWRRPVPGGGPVDIGDAYTHDHRYIFVAHGRLRCIDIRTGEDLWVAPDTYPFLSAHVTGSGSSFYFSAQSQVEPRLGAVFRGSTLTGEAQEITIAPYLDSLNNSSVGAVPEGIIQRVTPITVNGAEMLAVHSAFSYEDYGYHSLYRYSFLGLYNPTEGIWVWNTQPPTIWVHKFSATRVLVHDNMLVCRAVNRVLALELSTGDMVWEKDAVDRDNDNNDLVFYNGQIITYAALNSSINAISPIDGEGLWHVNIGYMQFNHLSSKINMLNGVVYVCSGGAANAVDLDREVKVWEIFPSTLRKGSDSDGFKECVAIPGVNGSLGRVVISTNRAVYCFEAVR